jgi:Apoptosis regulator proteins, Bcl-2 family
MSITNSTITSADILRIATQSLFPKPNFGHSFDVRTVDPVAQSVRRLVDVLCHDHSSDWTQIAADLGVSKRLAGILSYPQTDDQMNDALDVLEKSATFVLDQRKLNWGRVVAVLGLYVEMCRGWSRQVKIDPFQSNKLRHFVENRLAEAFGNFLDSYIGDWVLAHGGWVSFQPSFRLLDTGPHTVWATLRSWGPFCHLAEFDYKQSLRSLRIILNGPVTKHSVFLFAYTYKSL